MLQSTDAIKARIKQLQDRNTALRLQHPGVRPSWVSGDIGSNDSLIRDLQTKLYADPEAQSPYGVGNGELP